MKEFDQLKELLANQAPRKADAIVLLAGDRFHRVPKVAELYHAGFAPVVVITSSADNWDYGSLPSSKLVPELTKVGVKQGDIIWEETAPHTRAEADSTFRLAKERNWKSLILVTTQYHQYRAWLTWVKATRDVGIEIDLIMLPELSFPEFKEEKQEEVILQELERISFYQSKGDVATWQEGIDYLSTKNLL